jgi:hypothetical protein
MGDAQKEIGMNNLVTCLVVSVMSGAAFATTWTVDDDGKADFDNIQEAVDAASDGDEILVMPGTYTSTADEVVNMLGKAVWLHSSDGPDVTIIDGQDARRGITCESQETGETIIEGLTITGGRTFGEAHPDNSGGGMICHGAHPSLKDCTFTNNTAWSRGGGLYGINGGDTLTGCTFTDNNAQRGGAIFFISLNPTLDGCTFTNNTATIDGGGILSFNANSIMTNCTFSGNTVTGVAGKGGGVCTSSPENSPSSPIFEYCTFESNAADLGGGMHNGNYSSPVLINCTFTGNFATDNGGGMYNLQSSSSPTLTDTTVCGNTPDQIYGNWTDNGGNVVADECPLDCPDINGDGHVGITDLLTVIDVWGCTDCSDVDVNQDGIVNRDDLVIVIASWGACP